MQLLTGLIIAGAVLVAAALLYWQLVLAEGAYLGQRVVTWLYDLTAHRYDAIKHFRPDFETRCLGEPLADALQFIRQPMVLDVATGTGRLPLVLLAQQSFRGHIVGLDHARRMLKIATQKMQDYRNRLTLIWCDAARLPFPEAAFDAVTCLEMLEFTPDPSAQLAEIVRVLRPGGILLTTRRRGTSARLMPGKVPSPERLRALLTGLGIAQVELRPWQVEYDLVWGIKAGHSRASGGDPLATLRCPCCGTSAWIASGDALRCPECGHLLPIRDGIIEMV